MELFIWMKKNKVTAKKFAKDIGISEPSFSNIVNRRVNASLPTAIKIIDYTNAEIGGEHLINAESTKDIEKYFSERE